MAAASASGVDKLRARAGVDETDEPLLTRAAVTESVLTIGRAILLAVIILIVLGELYATSIVATPHEQHDPTATVEKEFQPSVANDTVTTLNVTTADHYYASGDHGPTLYNASGASDVELSASEYEFYENGTFKHTLGTTEDINVTYSYYNQNTFEALTATFASYGETAYIMVGLGLIALGASIALSFFGGFGGRGGR